MRRGVWFCWFRLGSDWILTFALLAGNDLARVLRWGSGYGSDDPHHILVSVDEADEVLMDRWTILMDARDVSEEGQDNCFLEPPKVCSKSIY